MTEGIYILVGATLLYLRVILVKILRDIKEDMESQKLTDTVATAETFKWIHATLPGIAQSELTADDVQMSTTFLHC